MFTRRAHKTCTLRMLTRMGILLKGSLAQSENRHIKKHSFNFPPSMLDKRIENFLKSVHLT
jgi:hypothetical protein